MHLIFANKRELVWHVKVESSFGHSDHRMLEFRILRGGSNTNRRIPNPGPWETSLGFLQGTAWIIP